MHCIGSGGAKSRPHPSMVVAKDPILLKEIECRPVGGHQHLQTREPWAADAIFLGAGLACKSTSRLPMARWHRDQGPMALLPPGVAENPEDR